MKKFQLIIKDGVNRYRRNSKEIFIHQVLVSASGESALFGDRSLFIEMELLFISLDTPNDILPFLRVLQCQRYLQTDTIISFPETCTRQRNRDKLSKVFSARID